MKSRVCDILGVEFPILAFSHCRDVVAAVTKAGGFGVLGAVAHTPEQLDIDLDVDRGGDRRQAVRRRPAAARQVRRRRRGRPRRATTVAPAAPRRAAGVRRRHPRALRRAAAARRRAQGAARPAASCASSPKRLRAAARRRLRPQDPADRQRPRPAAAVPGRAGARSTTWSSPRWPASAVHAERHQTPGVDLIVAQGTEAGGHTGEIATMVLVPEVVDAVSPTPGARRRRHRAAAGRWRRPWRSAPRACGAARCGSRPRRPRPTRS